MAIADSFQSLRDIDFNDLTLDTIGSWPAPIKVLVWLIIFCGVCFLGYNYHLKGMQEELAKVEQKEGQLKEEFKTKAFQAANLDAYREQMVQMEDQFGALLSQLPSDTEVPGLLEDITEKGLESGLEFETITLESERAAAFYIELPIDINVTGAYHDLGAFVSGVAGLPRIVTLHDFVIEPIGAGELAMRIQGKTYRYKEGAQ